MAPLSADWVSEYGDFSKPKVDELTEMVVSSKANLFAEKFTDETHFKRSFRESLTFRVREAQECEARYQKDLHSGETVKAVTAARDEIGAMLKGMKEHAVVLGPGGKPSGLLLETLRKTCRDTTLNLLCNMSAMADGLDVSFLTSFSRETWSPNSVEALLTYLRKLHKILGRSVRPGGANKDQASPILCQLIMDLGVIYTKYSGGGPSRSASHILVDGKDDVETQYVEGGQFKQFCIKAIALMDGDSAQIGNGLAMYEDGASLDKAIRETAKSLKGFRFTGPYDDQHLNL